MLAQSPLTPAPGLRWVFVDEARTHEVVATLVRDGHAWSLLVVERTPAGLDGREHLRVSHAVRDAWDLRFQLLALESRLGALGRYWRLESAGWRLVPPRAAQDDLRGVPLRIGPGLARVHPFHHPIEGTDRLLFALATHGDHSFIARVELADAKPTLAAILHRDLPPGPTRSLLASEHAEARSGGFDKLVTVAEVALHHGAEWEARFGDTLRSSLKRLARPEPAPALAPRIEHEEDQTPGGILTDPRLARVHAKFLGPGEEAALLSRGPHEVRRWIAAKRKEVAHADWHLMSVLEASLLLRMSLRAGSALDRDLVERLRHLTYYL